VCRIRTARAWLRCIRQRDAAVREVCTQVGILLLDVANADRQCQPATAQVIDRRRLFRDKQRVALGESLTTPHLAAEHRGPHSLGTGILVLPARPAACRRKQAATINHLSGGRLHWRSALATSSRSMPTCVQTSRTAAISLNETSQPCARLFESDTPQFHGPHINYADVLFSPRTGHLASQYWLAE